jgi:hypothetical protein
MPRWRHHSFFHSHLAELHHLPFSLGKPLSLASESLLCFLGGDPDKLVHKPSPVQIHSHLERMAMDGWSLLGIR